VPANPIAEKFNTWKYYTPCGKLRQEDFAGGIVPVGGKAGALHFINYKSKRQRSRKSGGLRLRLRVISHAPGLRAVAAATRACVTATERISDWHPLPSPISGTIRNYPELCGTMYRIVPLALNFPLPLITDDLTCPFRNFVVKLCGTCSAYSDGR
jgi:hypothetical protein